MFDRKLYFANNEIWKIQPFYLLQKYSFGGFKRNFKFNLCGLTLNIYFENLMKRYSQVWNIMRILKKKLLKILSVYYYEIHNFCSNKNFNDTIISKG